MATPARNSVLVIGAGVSGLTTAVCLAEYGLKVRVLAKDPPARTTSAHAGASWGPYMVSDPRVLDWSVETLNVLTALAHDRPDSGVRLVGGVEAATFRVEAPDWARSVPGFRVCGEAELPPGYISGWRYTIPLVDMPRYLEYLEARLGAAGVDLEIGGTMTLAEARRLAPLVVNCTGVGAREFAGDTGLNPTRGQLVVVDNPGVEEFFQDHADGDDVTYYLPHGDHVVLGGSARPESDDDEPDPTISASIIERCAKIEPRFAAARVLEDRVGVRPHRKPVRVEREDLDGFTVVHNYGHGGSGMTLSWGCAQEVLHQVLAWADTAEPVTESASAT
jgi:D-amino-acid oxidase